MGRYCFGDIEHKFWFGIQSSDAPERFGCYDDSNSCIHYSITKDEIQEVKNELDAIRENVKKKFNIDIDKAFEWYNNGDVEDHRSLNEYVGLKKQEEINEFYSEFADFELGTKIYKCLLENGECNFVAEL